MSHARPTLSLPIGSLANAVSFSAGFSPLITTAGSALLPSSSRSTAPLAAIALTTVTTAAHKEQDPTAHPLADPRAQRRFGHHRLDFGAHLITIPWIADDWTDDRAFGADDVAAHPLPGQRLRKLRFLMTDNTLDSNHRAAYTLFQP